MLPVTGGVAHQASLVITARSRAPFRTYPVQYSP